jgi:hypothetical protein
MSLRRNVDTSMDGRQREIRMNSETRLSREPPEKAIRNENVAEPRREQGRELAIAIRVPQGTAH